MSSRSRRAVRGLCALSFFCWITAATFTSLAAAQHHDVMHAGGAQAEEASSMPYARLGDDGRLHIVYVQNTESGRQVGYRQLYGEQPVESTISDPADQLTHWPESPPKLELAADGTIHVLYSVRPEAGSDQAAELRLVSSTDGGRSWSPYRVISDPESPVYRSCAAMRSDGKGRLIFSWLESHADQSVVGLKTAVLDGEDLHQEFADRSVCECCATELVPATEGSFLLGYRDVDERNVRDLYVLRLTSDNADSGPPQRVSRDQWALNGCPDTGPRFTTAGDGTIWAAWYTGNPRAIFTAAATDAAGSFGRRELIESADGETNVLKHPEIGTLPDGRIAVAYERRAVSGDRIMLRIREGESWAEPHEVAGPGEYPRIASNSNSAYLVYTAHEGERRSVEVVDLAGFTEK